MDYLPEIIFGLSAMAIIGAGLYKFTKENEWKCDDKIGAVFGYLAGLAKTILSIIPDLITKRVKK